MDIDELRERMEGSPEGFLGATAFVAWAGTGDDEGIAQIEVDDTRAIPVFTDPADVTVLLPAAEPRLMPMQLLVSMMPPGWAIQYDPTRDARKHLPPDQVDAMRARASELQARASNLTVDDRRARMVESAEGFLHTEAYIPVDDDGDAMTIDAPDGYTAIPVACDPTDHGRRGAGARLVPMLEVVRTIPPGWGIVFELDHDEWRRELTPDIVEALRRGEGLIPAAGQAPAAPVDPSVEELRTHMRSGPAGFLESMAWVAVDDAELVLREEDEHGGTVIAVFTDPADVLLRYDGTNERGVRARPMHWSMEHLVTVIPSGWSVLLDPGRAIALPLDAQYIDSLRVLTDPFPKDVPTSVAVADPSTDPDLFRHILEGAEHIPWSFSLWAVHVTKHSFTRPQLLFVVDGPGEAVQAIGRLMQRFDLAEEHIPVVVGSRQVPGATKEFKRLIKGATPLISRR